MQKVIVTKVRNYEFTGYIVDGSNDGLGVYGEFNVDWDDDIAMSMVTSMYTDNGLDLKLELFDTENIESQIDDRDNGSWLEDRMASAHDFNNFEDR